MRNLVGVRAPLLVFNSPFSSERASERGVRYFWTGRVLPLWGSRLFACCSCLGKNEILKVLQTYFWRKADRISATPDIKSSPNLLLEKCGQKVHYPRYSQDLNTFLTTPFHSSFINKDSPSTIL